MAPPSVPLFSIKLEFVNVKFESIKTEFVEFLIKVPSISICDFYAIKGLNKFSIMLSFESKMLEITSNKFFTLKIF